MSSCAIGPVTLPSPFVMAPIAGMTDGPYRRLVMAEGAGLTVSELLSANAIVRDSAKTLLMLPEPDEPKPVAVQLFGGEPDVVAEAAGMVEELGRCAIIDLNYGCPVKKVTKTGGGAALLCDPAKGEKMAAAVVRRLRLPVTVKIRTGWGRESINALELAKRLEGAGVAAVAIHGRTALQGYGGEADWEIINTVAENLTIPVIGNGDVLTPEQGVTRLGEGACHLIMIGRGALGYPFFFSEANTLLAGKKPQKASSEKIGSVILRHIDLMIERYGETIAIKKMRAHFAYYTRGRPNASSFRVAANTATDYHSVRSLVEDFFITNRTTL